MNKSPYRSSDELTIDELKREITDAEHWTEHWRAQALEKAEEVCELKYKHFWNVFALMALIFVVSGAITVVGAALTDNYFEPQGNEHRAEVIAERWMDDNYGPFRNVAYCDELVMGPDGRTSRTELKLVAGWYRCFFFDRDKGRHVYNLVCDLKEQECY